MNVLCFLDREYRTPESEDMREKIAGLAKARGHSFETVELGRNDLVPCMGCLACFTKHPGRCVGRDRLTEISEIILRDRCILVFLTPVVFGQFGSTIKNMLDKSGLYMEQYHAQIMIGYGDEIDEEEESTFIDIIVKHRGEADIVHAGQRNQRFEVFVARSAGDNDRITEYLRTRNYLWGER